MGLAAARSLAADGALVAVAGRDAERAAAAAASIDGPPAIGIVADVTREGEAERAVSEALQTLGRLDGVAVTTGTSRAAHATLGEATDAACGPRRSRTS